MKIEITHLDNYLPAISGYIIIGSGLVSFKQTLKMLPCYHSKLTGRGGGWGLGYT